MWPYTDNESDWLDSRKADIAAGRPVYSEPALVAYYVREGKRLRAEAAAQMFRTIGRAIGRGARRLFAGPRSRLVGGPARPAA